MAGDRRKPGLGKEDNNLWKQVTENLTPLSKKVRNFQREDTVDTGKDKFTGKKFRPEKVTRPAPPPPIPTPYIPPRSSPGEMETKRVRRLGRGNLSFDARIDLHGMYQKEAHSRLLMFLREARARGYRNVLVITGKGRAGDRSNEPGREAPGVIRRNIRHWLNEPEFSEIVTALSSARPNHGGEGALYLQIRRVRD